MTAPEDRTRDREGAFFPLPALDGAFLVFLVVAVVVAFMPWARHVQWAGIALVGWLMAALMVVTPLLALARTLLETREPPGGDR